MLFLASLNTGGGYPGAGSEGRGVGDEVDVGAIVEEGTVELEGTGTDELEGGGLVPDGLGLMKNFL